jgi:15-cis-phytoene synthase
MSLPVQLEASGRQAPLENEELREGLLQAWELLGDSDIGAFSPVLFGGQLLRPRFTVSVAGEERSRRLEETLWLAALGVQLAHEASLLHDDVVDGATMRRGRPTLVERKGVGAAIVGGDQLLARGYLAIARAGDPALALAFARAIDRTIAGELAQSRTIGSRVDEASMREIAAGKSGELFAFAFAAGAILDNASEAAALHRLGRDIGTLYQRVDDLLDFCPTARTGKTPFADASRGLWTWPRCYLSDGAPPEAFFASRDGLLPAERALQDLESECAGLRRRLAREVPWARDVDEAVCGWLATARRAVESEAGARASSPRPDPVRRPASEGDAGEGPDGSSSPGEILAYHGRSFHFASRLMPSSARASATRVYAFCRLVDDAVDQAPSREAAEAQLERLFRSASEAFHGEGKGGGFLEATMRDMRTAEVPFSIVEELVEGVRMDLVPRRYQAREELRVYTHRVAGVVGLWIAGLAGIRDPWALRMANELGHAMQLTNIARDVGADLAMGRVYLPLDLLERHGLSEEELVRVIQEDAPIPPGYAAALEELMGWADAGYGSSFQALPHLPAEYRRGMAVASRVYQGIHRAIRKAGYDTLRHRASTGTFTKAKLALGALHDVAGTAKWRGFRGGRPAS